MTTSPTQPLHEHHKHCDELFAAAEAAAYRRQWPECLAQFQRFHGEIEAHFSTEEQVLFPAFEQMTGVVAGPVQMMRVEHAQMRALLAEMLQAATAQQAEHFSGSAETLLVLMQQHNMKEENILYPMCERVLAGHEVSVDVELRQRVTAACPA